jgi:hypothetical protein
MTTHILKKPQHHLGQVLVKGITKATIDVLLIKIIPTASTDFWRATDLLRIKSRNCSKTETFVFFACAAARRPLQQCGASVLDM